MRENENTNPTHEEAIPTPTVTTDKFGGTEVSHFVPSGSRFSAIASAETPSDFFNNPETIAPLTSSPVVDDNLTDGSNISRASLNYFKGEELASKIWVTKKSHTTKSNGGYTLGGTLRSAFRMLRDASLLNKTLHRSDSNRYFLSNMFRRSSGCDQGMDDLLFLNGSDTLSVDEMFSPGGISTLYDDELFLPGGKTSLFTNKELLPKWESGMSADRPFSPVGKTISYADGGVFPSGKSTLSLSELFLHTVKSVTLLIWELFLADDDTSYSFDEISAYEETALSAQLRLFNSANRSYTHPALFAYIYKVRLANLDRHLSAYITILYKGVTVDKVAGRAPPFIYFIFSSLCYLSRMQ